MKNSLKKKIASCKDHKPTGQVTWSHFCSKIYFLNKYIFFSFKGNSDKLLQNIVVHIFLPSFSPISVITTLFTFLRTHYQREEYLILGGKVSDHLILEDYNHLY